MTEKWKNQIPGSYPAQNLIDCSLAKDLSFHKIWFNSINNPDPYLHQSNSLTKCFLSKGLPSQIS